MFWGYDSDHDFVYYEPDYDDCDDYGDSYGYDYDDYDVYVRRRSSYDGSRRFANDAHGRELRAELASQRETGEFLDVVVQVEGREFPCHRAVLASTPYFKAMLSSDLAESNSKVVHLRGIDSITFSKILDFVYTGVIYISEEDVQDILQAAHMLQFDKIMQYCREFIQDNLSPSNCLGVLRLADMYDLSALRKSARHKAVSHFSEVAQDEEFPSLSMKELLDLLTDDDLQVANEDDVVYSVLRWLDHAPEDRKTEVFQILQEISLSHVRVSVLRKLESHPVIQESSECLARITAAKEEHLTGTRQLDTGAGGSMTTSKFRRGISDDLAIIVGGWKEAKRRSYVYNEDPIEPTPLQSIICVDPDSQQHYHVTNLPTPVCGYMSVTCADRRLYVTGGRAHPLVGQGPHSEPSRQAFWYDFPTDTWLRLPDMPRGRAEHQSVVVDGKLFVVGGDVEATSVWSMDCYDLEEEAWIEAPVLPTVDATSDLTVTSVGDKVVLIEVSESSVDRQIDHVQFGVALLLGAQLGFRIPMTMDRSRTKLTVHVFDVKTKRWAYSDMLLENSFEDEDIFVIAVDHTLYLRFQSYQSDIYAYDAKNQILAKVENKQVFTGSFPRPELRSHRYWYADRHKGAMDTIANYKFDGNRRMERQETTSSLPFVLFGHNLLGTKKSTVGWYCRDLTELEKDDDTGDE